MHLIIFTEGEKQPVSSKVNFNAKPAAGTKRASSKQLNARD